MKQSSTGWSAGGHTVTSMVGNALTWGASWLGWVFVLAIIAFPLAYRLMPRLAGRGIALSPALGVLAVSYLSWLLASVHLAPFGRGSALLAVGIVALLSAVVEVWSRGEAMRWLGRNFALAVLYAVALVAIFALFCWLRGFYPDIRSTEKPMEIEFLTSTMGARWMPPTDAWLSGFTINYYYFGYVEAATVGLLGGLRPEVTFNLMSCTLPALTFVGASGIAFDLLARYRAERGIAHAKIGTAGVALIGGVMVAIAGNAYGLARLLAAPGTILSANFWSGIGWNSSRVVHDHIEPGKVAEMITEFPMFSFVLGDIHPHVLALPTVLLAIGVAFGLWTMPGAPGWGRVARYCGAALVIGALYPTNAWDLPTFALPIVAAIIVRRWRGRRDALVRGGGVIAGAVALYLPYYLHFKSIVGHEGDEPIAIQDLARAPVIGPVLGRVIRTFGVVIWPHTDIREFLAFFAVPLAAAAALVLRGNIGRRTSFTGAQRRGFLCAALGIVVVALVTRTAALLPTGAVILAGVAALLRPIARRPPDASPWSQWMPLDRAMTAFAVYGALLPVIPEFLFLRDAFDNRMNTMFKVDYQAWIILMVAGAYGVITLLDTARKTPLHAIARFPRWSLRPLYAAVTIFALFALTYPVIVPFQRTGHFGAQGIDFGGPGLGWQGLDGFAFVRQSNPDEFRAALWLREHAQAGDRLIESVGNSYGDANGWFESRFAAATGTPDVLGWYFHEYQWREGSPSIINRDLPQRAMDIGTFYNTTSMPEARAILAKYGVTWVIVGITEQDGEGRCGLPAGCPPYTAQGLAKFNDMLDLAFRTGRVSIYHVP